jgi:hypothetical protein
MNYEIENDNDNIAEAMSALEFARLGGGEFAYIRRLASDEAHAMFPALKGLPTGIDLYALVAADGTPLSISDSRTSAIATALENDLEPVSVH